MPAGDQFENPYADQKALLKPIGLNPDAWERVWDNFLRSEQFSLSERPIVGSWLYTSECVTNIYVFRDVGRDAGSLQRSLGRTADQLSTIGRRVTSVDDLIDIHLDFADGTSAGKRFYRAIDANLGSEDAGQGSECQLYLCNQE